MRDRERSVQKILPAKDRLEYREVMMMKAMTAKKNAVAKETMAKMRRLMASSLMVGGVALGAVTADAMAVEKTEPILTSEATSDVSPESAADSEALDASWRTARLRWADDAEVVGDRIVADDNTTEVSSEPTATFNSTRFDSANEAQAELESTPRRFLQTDWMTRNRIDFGGWLEQGVAMGSHRAGDRWTGPVQMRDREWDVNQFWMFLGRETDTSKRDWDIGGRMDFMWGTDGPWMQSADGWDEKWGGDYYGFAFPQLYTEFAYKNLTVKAGRFFTILGYEGIAATQRPFYTTSYCYGSEPFIYLGVIADYKLNDRLTFRTGFHRGDDQVDDTDGKEGLTWMGGTTWNAPWETTSMTWNVTAGEQGPGNTKVFSSLVAEQEVTDRLAYAMVWDYSYTDGTVENGIRDGQATWYGIANYLSYEFNPKVVGNLRGEWFRDEDGAIIASYGRNSYAADGGFMGNFVELTAGFTWSPLTNLQVRPELRADFFDKTNDASALPFGNSDKSSQLLGAMDVIMHF